MEKIVVIGGYGKVGSYVAKALENYGEKVVVAGRNAEKAKRFAEKETIEGAYMELDVTAIHNWKLEQVKTIIMCLEGRNEEVLEYCIRHRINYIDISPSYSILERLEKHKCEIEKAGIKVVLGVGIAPGISNVLCKEAIRGLESIKAVNSYLMLGIREKHGHNAVQWLVDNLDTVFEDSRGEVVKSFVDTHKIVLPDSNKKKTFARVDLADSHLMRNTKDSLPADSWFAYDVEGITKLVVFFKRAGMFSLLNNQHVKKFMVAYLEILLKIGMLLHIGTDHYASLVVAEGYREGKPEKRSYMISGKCNSQITGRVCALAAVKLEKQESGIRYTEDIITLEEVKHLMKSGVSFKVEKNVDPNVTL